MSHFTKRQVNATLFIATSQNNLSCSGKEGSCAWLLEMGILCISFDKMDVSMLSIEPRWKEGGCIQAQVEWLCECICVYVC